MADRTSNVRVQFTVDGDGNVVSAFNQGADAARGFGRGADEAHGSAESLTGSLTSLKTAAAGLGAGLALDAIVKSTAAMQGYNAVLVVATGSQTAAAREMDFLKSTAAQYGLQIDSVAKGYADLSVAAMSTRITQAGVRDIFDSTAKAAAALHLTGDQTTEVLHAMQLMMERGTVSQQELVRMLGSNIPNATALAAAALDTGTLELKKMLATGEVLSADFLPKFADQLSKVYGASSGQGFQGITGDLNRLSDELKEIEDTLGKGPVGAGVTALAQGTAQAFKAANDDAGDFVGTLKLTGDVLLGIAAIMGAQWVQGLAQSTAAVLADATAWRSETQAALTAAQVRAEAAAENLAFTRTVLQSQAALALETGDIAGATSALEAYQAATAEAASAQTALAAAEGEASVGATAFDAALGFLGGLPGLIFLGVAAFAALTLGMQDSSEQAASLDAEINKTARDLQDFATLTQAQQAHLIDLKAQQIAALQDQRQQLQEQQRYAAGGNEAGVTLSQQYRNDLAAQLDAVNQKLALANRQMQDFNQLYLGVVHTGSQLSTLPRSGELPPGLGTFGPLDQVPTLSNKPQGLDTSVAGWQDWIEQEKKQAELAKQMLDTLHPDVVLQQQQQAVQQLIGTTVDGYTFTAQDAAKYMDDLRKKSTQMSVFADQAARNMQDSFAQFLFDPFKGGLDGMVKGFGQAMQQMIAQAAAAAILDHIVGNGASGSGQAAISAFFSNFFTSGSNTPPAKAGGGDVMGGMPYLVGEKGPELYVPGMSGSIIPNGMLGRLGGGPSVNITSHVDARGSVSPGMVIAAVEAGRQRTLADVYNILSGRGWPTS